MAGIGFGYDLSVSTFSPDGRVFQVEYATKAVDNGGTAVGIVCKDGILIAVEKLISSKMVVPESTPRIFAVDYHSSIAVAGFIPDAREIVNTARNEAKQYRRIYGETIPGKILSERLAVFVHAYTSAWSERPFGASILLAVCDKPNNSLQPAQLSLYSIDPAGTCYKYFGTALGKGRQTAKTEIEKYDLKNMSLSDMSVDGPVVKVAKLMLQVHAENREKDMELEMAVISATTDWKHRMLTRSVVETAEEEAKKLIAAADEDIDMTRLQS